MEPIRMLPPQSSPEFPNSALERQLDEIEVLARAVELGDVKRSPALRLRALELIGGLAERLIWEEQVLLPAIRSSRPWGTERAELLQEEQSEQRMVLRLQLDALTDPDRPPALVACGLRDFTHLVRESLDHERCLAHDPMSLQDDMFVDVETF